MYGHLLNILFLFHLLCYLMFIFFKNNFVWYKNSQMHIIFLVLHLWILEGLRVFFQFFWTWFSYKQLFHKTYQDQLIISMKTKFVNGHLHFLLLRKYKDHLDFIQILVAKQHDQNVNLKKPSPLLKGNDLFCIIKYHLSQKYLWIILLIWNRISMGFSDQELMSYFSIPNFIRCEDLYFIPKFQLFIHRHIWK